MKNILFWIGLVAMSTALQFCKNESSPVALQKVQFTFGVHPTAPSGGRIETAEPVALLLSLENSIGDPVFTSKRIPLLHIGSNLMTDPIDLPPGTYTITDFLLVDDDNNVLYATPKAGSPLAAAVTHPLPYSFVVSNSEVTNVDMEVVDVSQRIPEDFGYATFQINYINTLKVAVFVSVDGEVSMTTAEATLTQGSTTIGTYSLEARTNVIAFSGEPNMIYRLVVTKEGYRTYTKDFIFSELLDALHGEPLKVLLNQFTMLAVVDDNLFFSCAVGGGASKTIEVAWGDGTHEEIAFPSDVEPTGLNHTYPAPGKYEISITGALETVWWFSAGFNLGKIDAIDFQALPNLRVMLINRNHGPETVDLSLNPELESVAVEGIPQLKHVILPATHHIFDMNINGPNQLSTDEVDAIIHSLLLSADRTRPGMLRFDQSFEEPTNLMVGPPSPVGIRDLTYLKVIGRWTLIPDLDI